MLNQLKKISATLLEQQTFDFLSVAVIDFKSHKYDFFNLNKLGTDPIFDLASLTKPLTLSLNYFKNPGLFKENSKLKLLLNHQGSLISGGRLNHSDWKKQLLKYEIKESPTVYSDYSALRLMLELKIDFEKSCKEFLGSKVLFWKDLTHEQKLKCAPTGTRNGKVIQGEVHDPNAYTINEFCSHAGLFSNIKNLAETVIDFDKKFALIQKMTEEFNAPKLSRFILGWDHAEDLENTLAGKGCSAKTFGHLGFTGTSIWIDIERLQGHIILTNATQTYWYDRTPLNNLRKALGSFIWNMKD